MFHLCVTHRSGLFVKFVFKHIQAACIYTICSINVLSAVRMSTFIYLINTDPSLILLYVVLLCLLNEVNIFLSIFSYPFNILEIFNLISS